jgi:alpha-N-acetylglucosamine transferase
MTKYFCTLFDSGYLIKGITMIESLMRQSPDPHVFVLCLDQQTTDIVNRLDIQGVTCISLDDVETEELLQAKKTRGVAEYCWTLSPCFPWYLFQNYPEIDLLTYLDSDLLFYSPIQPIFDEIGENSVAIIEHRFAPRLRDREVNGRFATRKDWPVSPDGAINASNGVTIVWKTEKWGIRNIWMNGQTDTRTVIS